MCPQSHVPGGFQGFGMAPDGYPSAAHGVVTYSGWQARGAHLTPDSPGGAAILRRLGFRTKLKS